jgi:prepilin-type N-terminal cleavage/methylation domain-containing protein/prepilin-type processing-associated H-X9-DG protein
MNLSSQRHGAFTLLELLTVITIIGILASMLFPITSSVIDRGRTVACASNLRQLWVAVQASANDNDNTFPEIKITPDDSTAGEGAKELKETLQPYGIGDKVLQCPGDLAGPNHFATMNTSYMWQTIVEDEFTTSVKIYGRRRIIAAQPSRVPVLQDWAPVHPPQKAGQGKTMNTIFLDGHVTLR